MRLDDFVIPYMQLIQTSIFECCLVLRSADRQTKTMQLYGWVQLSRITHPVESVTHWLCLSEKKCLGINKLWLNVVRIFYEITSPHLSVITAKYNV